MKNQIPRIRVKALLALAFAVFTLSFKIQAQDGAKLFKQNCAVCHASHTDQKLTGPGLKGIFDRAPKGRNETGVWLKRHDEYGKR